jgi:hypothetical protein
MVRDFGVCHSAALAAVAMDRLILVLLAVAKFRAKPCQPGFIRFEGNDSSSGHPAQLSHRTRRIVTVVQAAVDDRHVERPIVIGQVLDVLMLPLERAVVLVPVMGCQIADHHIGETCRQQGDSVEVAPQVTSTRSEGLSPPLAISRCRTSR